VRKPHTHEFKPLSTTGARASQQTPQAIQEMLQTAGEIVEANPDFVYEWSGMPGSLHLPPGWKVLDYSPVMSWYRSQDGLRVGLSVNKEQDGRLWLHASFSRDFRMPSYEDMKTVKRIFVGQDRVAYQVFPKAESHANAMQFCLHLFSLLDGSEALPDFTRNLGFL